MQRAVEEPEMDLRDIVYHTKGERRFCDTTEEEIPHGRGKRNTHQCLGTQCTSVIHRHRERHRQPPSGRKDHTNEGQQVW
eukprot:8380754-Pyramimonas_sp.AAC.1